MENLMVMPDVCGACTALIVTHASKCSPELGDKSVLYYPGAPQTDLLKKVISNIRSSIGIYKFLICIDHKIDCHVSLAYLENLRSLCVDGDIRLIISPSAVKVPSQVSATHAFYRGICAVSSDNVLFFEHDHLFLSSIDQNIVNRAFARGCKLLRFNRSQNINTDFEILVNSENIEGVCETNMYCNGPFIADTKFCRRLFRIAMLGIPYWNGHFGGHIEGPISREIMFDFYNLSRSEFRTKYPIYMYGSIGFHPAIVHFGDFTGRKGRLISLVKKLLRRFFSLWLYNHDVGRGT